MYTSLGKSKMYFNDAGTRSIKLSAVKQLLAWPKHFLLRLIRFESGIQNMPQNACKSKPGLAHSQSTLLGYSLLTVASTI